MKVSFSRKVAFSWKARTSLTAAFLNPENSLEAIWLGGGILKIR